MKHIFQSFLSWWFTNMTPARTPLTTLVQRETMRKRRLFSLIPPITLVICLGYIVSAVITTSFTYEMPVYALEIGFMLLALWLNRQGYLKIACVIFYLCYGLTTLMAAQTTSLSDPHLLLWTCFLMTTFLVSLGFFVPAWLIFLSAVGENLLFFCYLLVINHAQIARLLSPSELQHALLYLCLLLYASAF